LISTRLCQFWRPTRTPCAFFLVAAQKLVFSQVIGQKAAVTTDMKLTLAFLSLLLTLGLGACTTAAKATRQVTLEPCCATAAPGTVVLLQDSFTPGGRVVRLAPPSSSSSAE
jgi:hypothetical protein